MKRLIEIISNLINNLDDSMLLYSSDDIDIVCSGIIVNLKELSQKHQLAEEEVLIKLYRDYGTSFPNQLEGAFGLIVYDKHKEELLLFADHFSSKPLFYYDNEGSFSFHHDLFKLVQEVHSSKLALNYDWNTFAYMSKYGHMPGNATFFKEVKKLQAGKYLSFSENGSALYDYHKWSFSKNNKITFDQAVDELNGLFERAVHLNFSRDVELEKQHLGSLSGGLDSRMTLLMASKLGFKNINHFTFSNKGYWDEAIAKQIAQKMNFKGHFYYLNERKFSMEDFEEIFTLNSGTVMYHLITHLPDAYRELPLEKFGTLHTGQVGDAVVGNSLHKFENHLSSGVKRGFYNEQDSFVNEIWFAECEKYETLEEAQFQNHVFNYALNGDWITATFIPSLSPFLNQKVFGFCLDLPLEYRHNQRLYKAWMKKYFPESGKFYYEKSKAVTFRDRSLKSKLLRKVQLKYEHIKLKSFGLDKTVNNLLGLENLKLEFQNNALDKHVMEVLSFIPHEMLKKRLESMLKDSNIHSSYLALHIALTLKKYNSVIQN